MVSTFLYNVHNFVIKILILNAKNQSIFFSDVRRMDMDHLSLKKQLPSVSLVSSGADLITMLSSWLYNAHSFVINRLTFSPVLILSAFQNWTKFPTAQQPNFGWLLTTVHAEIQITRNCGRRRSILAAGDRHPMLMERW